MSLFKGEASPPMIENKHSYNSCISSTDNSQTVTKYNSYSSHLDSSFEEILGSTAKYYEVIEEYLGNF